MNMHRPPSLARPLLPLVVRPMSLCIVTNRVVLRRYGARRRRSAVLAEDDGGVSAERKVDTGRHAVIVLIERQYRPWGAASVEPTVVPGVVGAESNLPCTAPWRAYGVGVVAAIGEVGDDEHIVARSATSPPVVGDHLVGVVDVMDLHPAAAQPTRRGGPVPA